MLHLPECALILSELKNSLPSYIDYHSIGHTLDVYHRALEIANAEEIPPADQRLLGVAAIYHDSGYLTTSAGHEALSCKLANEHLACFDYSQADIDTICGIIMATHVPQKPTTHLQQILCDADMDYLGRDDFFELSDRLYNELHSQGLIDDLTQWNSMQIAFLTRHRYYTKSAIKRRQMAKQQNLKRLESKIAAL